MLFGHISEQLVDAFIQFGQYFERRTATLASQLLRKLFQSITGLGKLTRQHHFPVVVAGSQGVQVGPVACLRSSRRWHRLNLNCGLRRDFNLGVRSRNIEMMHGIASEIAVLGDIGGRVNVKM